MRVQCLTPHSLDRLCVRVCARACVRARACVCAHECVCALGCVSGCACVYERQKGECVCIQCLTPHRVSRLCVRGGWGVGGKSE